MVLSDVRCLVNSLLSPQPPLLPSLHTLLSVVSVACHEIFFPSDISERHLHETKAAYYLQFLVAVLFSNIRAYNTGEYECTLTQLYTFCSYFCCVWNMDLSKDLIREKEKRYEM